MPPIIIALIVLAGLLIISLPLIRMAVKRFIARKAQQTRIIERDPLLVGLQPGKPAIVYFTSPGCGPCRLTQKPIIQKLQTELGDNLQLLTVDIEQQLDDALRWGVMKVPRTFVLDHNLRPYVSNLNIATLDTLKGQIADAELHADLPIDGLQIVGG